LPRYYLKIFNGWGYIRRYPTVIIPAASISECHPCSSQDFARRATGEIPWVVMADPEGYEFRVLSPR
jgi:hypothetical protein